MPRTGDNVSKFYRFNGGANAQFIRSILIYLIYASATFNHLTGADVDFCFTSFVVVVDVRRRFMNTL